MLTMLKNKSFSSFQQPNSLSRLEQLVVRRRNSEQYCNTVCVFWDTHTGIPVSKSCLMRFCIYIKNVFHSFITTKFLLTEVHILQC